MSFTPLDKNFALLLINFQKGIVSEPPQSEADEAIQNAVLLADTCLTFGHPVIIITSNPFLGKLIKARCDDPMFPPGTDLHQKEAEMRDQGWFDLIPELKTLSPVLEIVKPAWDAFFGTDLQNELKRLNITQLLIGGISTSSDLFATATTASELGYNLAFPLDAMADADPDAGDVAKVKKLPKLGQTGTTTTLAGLIR